MNIGKMQGGHALNALAAHAQAEIFFRVVTDPDSLLAQVNTVVAGRAKVEAFGKQLHNG